jgi:hypothetical protein
MGGNNNCQTKYLLAAIEIYRGELRREISLQQQIP